MHEMVWKSVKEAQCRHKNTLKRCFKPVEHNEQCKVQNTNCTRRNSDEAKPIRIVEAILNTILIQQYTTFTEYYTKEAGLAHTLVSKENIHICNSHDISARLLFHDISQCT